MNRNLVLRRLCWKEFRQLWPLILMLAVVGLVFQLLLPFSSPSLFHLSQNIFFLGLPCLFASGIGAMLVAQERDTRTLNWIMSLPIPKQDIIRIKFLAGAVGLAFVWIINSVLLLISSRFAIVGDNVFQQDLDLSYGILYSIFLNCVSFATAWYFRSTFVGLLTLAGVAATYTLATNILTESKLSDAISLYTLLAASALALWLGWVSALRTLSPVTPNRLPKQAIEGSSYFDRSVVDRRGIHSPHSALIWQFAAQNRAMLFGLAILFLLPLILVCLIKTFNQAFWYEGNSPLPPIFMVCTVSVFVSVSWLGVVTFQGDNLGHRIRFLSDRGISPRMVWLTRQAIPIGMMVGGSIAVGCVVAFVFTFWMQSGSASRQVELQSIIWGIFVFASLIWSLYSVSQWMSQILRSPVLAAIIAPVVCCLPIAYGAFAYETLESPIWILAITTCIPMIATYRMTRHWMDSRMGKRYWLEHAGWLGLVVLLPAIPFLIVYCSYPSMPTSEWVEFVTAARRLNSSNRPTAEINELITRDKNQNVYALSEMLEPDMPMGTGGEASGAGGEASGMPDGLGMFANSVVSNVLPENLSLAEERELQLKHIEQQLQSTGSSIPISANQAAKRLMGEAMLARIQMQDDGISETLLNRYRRTVSMMIRIIQGARLTAHLNTQRVADQYEAWLVKEMQSEGSDKFMGRELRHEALTQLGDKAGRENARYRALVVDWANSQSTSRTAPDHTLGGYAIPTSSNGTRLISRRHVSTVAWRMKQYLKASDVETRNQAKQALAREWNVSVSGFWNDCDTIYSVCRDQFTLGPLVR